MSIQARW
ncbi:hypothetical protein E2C01_033594 [Portunus trituberculatus]|nr:hypothetical protein [Portunus trituberculatus]